MHSDARSIAPGSARLTSLKRRSRSEVARTYGRIAPSPAKKKTRMDGSSVMVTETIPSPAKPTVPIALSATNSFAVSPSQSPECLSSSSI